MKPADERSRATDVYASGVVVAALQTLLAAAQAKNREEGRNLLMVELWSDGCGAIRFGGRSFGGMFKPLAGAVAEFEDWLARDEVAELNATLGIAQ